MAITITQLAQGTDPGARVELFTLDITGQGGQLLPYCAMVNELGNPVVFNGTSFTPVPIQAEGFEKTSQGPMPRPKLRLSVLTPGVIALLQQYQDLVGCVVSRYVTFARFLDAVNFAAGNVDADPGQYFGPDVFKVERKTAHKRRQYVEWELSAAIDQEDKKLPGRQVVRTACGWNYRRSDGRGGFIYDTTTRGCPYTGAACFDRQNNPTTAANDVCSHNEDGCKARFGAKAPLPGGFFLGAGLSG